MFMFPFITNAKQDTNLISLDTENLSLVFTVSNEGKLNLNYFGERIENKSAFSLKRSYRTAEYGTSNEAYSTAGGKNFREPALRITHFDGDLNTELVFVNSERVFDEENRTEELVISLKDKKYPLVVKLHYKAYKTENVYAMHTEIINDEKSDIELHNFYSFYLPIDARSYYLTHFYGTATKEMSVEEIPLQHGMFSIESRKGIRATHGENPSFMLSLNKPLDEDAGEVIAGALAWSGNFKLNFEKDEFNTLNLSGGINPYASEYKLAKGENFTTPKMIFTYSFNGAGQASRNMHDWARKEGLYDSKAVRPIVLNSWEGVYFSFTEEKIKQMIDEASELGIEVFVLDDGWFGNNYPRNDASMGLGDWQVNRKKLPNGIDYLAKYAVSKGMKFGIWIEPEMVNPKSDLANEHPDWIVKSEGREIPSKRNQWVLDMSNPDVQDFVFNVFDGVMQLSKDISYIKWDANRHLESVGSTWLPKDKQSHFWIEYVRGLYNVYDRIRAKYPNVMIQACSSGGGRVEFGSLKYHQDFWTSDNTDAHSRAFIQYGTNLIYPAIATGAHFSHVPNRHTKRVTPLKFRMDMAMTGRLGFEMKLSDLSAEEQGILKSSINEYKEIRDIIQFGDLFRIVSPYDDSGYYSLMYVSKDKKRALFYAFCLDYKGYLLTTNFKLKGLSADKRYKIKELNNPNPSFWANGKTIEGDFLLKEGLNPNMNNAYQSIVLYLEDAGMD
jgi:alpha-galactosidase